MPATSSRKSPRRTPKHWPSRQQDAKNRIAKPASGRDLVDALAKAPMRGVRLQRPSVKIRARTVDL